MVCFATTFGVILLLGLTVHAATNNDTCDIYAAVGESLALPFVFKGLGNSHALKWTHNNTIIFYRQQGKVTVGKSDDISATGSLLLKKLQFASAGIYQAQALNPNGTSAAELAVRVCMMEKVAKPKLSYVCDLKKNAINLNCYVPKPQGLVFSWTLDKKTLQSETKQTLSVSLNQPKDEGSFFCSVENKVSKESSDAVRPTCKAPPEICFSPHTVVAVLAGGAGLIFLLLIIVIALCYCKRRNNTQMKFRDKGEHGMFSLKKQEADSISREYETMHHTENCPPSSPQPSPRVSYQNVSQPEDQIENRPAQLSMAAEGQQQPSPVPKPRKKNTQTQNITMC
ncbi:uncharacterized protein LOC121647086 [Melanotaenia boesemani]|uniref:uncharacterized protein LOC121647086 n=1 Tax=Melanotaenia boesemani TaxID=1250792 RepID=UPI001C042BFD|nr:uncharacterized protein LOC121647086 [Melanotaenia boesemani]